MRKHKRNPIVAPLPFTFHAVDDHIVAVAYIGDSSIGLRFNSAEQLLAFMAGMMEQAARVWPDNPLVKEYLEE